jgi:SAM-dependent methyltransferase
MHPDRRAAPRIWDPDWHVLRRQAQAIRAALADPRLELAGARVLDFGCGSRPYESWFAAAGARYQGADIEGSPDIAVRADGTLAAGDGQYHVVASFQVLEHVWDVGGYLREAWRVLRAEGWLLLSTHGAWLYHPHPHDYRRWTGEGLRREVEAQGFRLVRMQPVVGPLAWMMVFHNLGIAHALQKVPGLGKVLSPLCSLPLNMLAWLEDQITPAYITENNACVYVALFQRAA